MRDRAAWSLLASNLLLLAVALWREWPLGLLLWPYWAQSVIIGWFSRRRILVAENHVVGGLKLTINGRELRRDEMTPERVASFFTLHFGFFHLGYLVFLLVMTFQVSASAFSGRDFLYAMAQTIPFFLAHLQSHRENVESDLGGRPDLGKLMSIPYLRVIPMHLTIILGFALVTGDHERWAILLFVGLKTFADLGMHAVEHRRLRGSAAGVGAA